MQLAAYVFLVPLSNILSELIELFGDFGHCSSIAK
jgi:hypothetical protein